MKEKQLWDAFGAIDERYLEIAEKTTAPQRRISLRRTAGLILAAAVCLSLLAVTAVAAGWVPSIFELLQEQFPEETVYAQAAQASQTQIPEVVELPKMDASKFVLSQSYYDGQTTTDRRGIIYGTDGIIEVMNVNNPEEIRIYSSDRNPELLETIPVSHGISGYEYELKEAAECIEKGRLEPESMPWNETLRVLRIMDSLRSIWGIKLASELE